MITEADKLAARNFFDRTEWHSDPEADLQEILATHRQQAAKAERDRLRELPDDVVKAAMERANAVGQATMPDTAEEAFRIVATALADALEGEQHVD